jgi:hypothetical protein
MVTRRYIQPQKESAPPRETRPVSRGVVRNQRLAKSFELNARKTVDVRNWPAVRPTVCAVEA